MSSLLKLHVVSLLSYKGQNDDIIYSVITYGITRHYYGMTHLFKDCEFFLNFLLDTADNDCRLADRRVLNLK